MSARRVTVRDEESLVKTRFMLLTDGAGRTAQRHPARDDDGTV